MREFSRDHSDARVRLELVTLNGERLDALQLRADEKGTSISTRDDRLVFLPYSLIAYVDIAILRDHRVPGFQLSVGSDAAASSLSAGLAGLRVRPLASSSDPASGDGLSDGFRGSVGA